MSNPPSSSTFIGRILDRLERLPGVKGRASQAIFLGAYFMLALSMYLVVLKVRGHDKQFVTNTAWDDAMPFYPSWTWIYLVPYVIGPIVAIALRRRAFEWYIRAATIVLVITLIIFIVFPTQTLRPPRPADDNLTGWLYNTMVDMDDPPANAAPSLHVSLSCLLAWAIIFDLPRWTWAAALGAILVWLSTLLTKQHHLIDVGTGAALATIIALWRRRHLDSETVSSSQMLSDAR